MNIKTVIDQIECFAPLEYQEPYDNSGVQVGDFQQEVKGALLCVDITEEVVDEAIAKGCNLVISHHPLLFHAIKKITPDNYINRCVIKAIKNDIVLYSCHTNIDKVKNGVSFRIAEKLGVRMVKLLAQDPQNPNIGLGIVGELDKEQTLKDFLSRTKSVTGIKAIRYTPAPLEKKIKRVALCGGSGHEFLADAIKEKADIYLTADLKYPDFFNTEGKIILADIGHFESEQFTKEIFYDILSKINPKFAINFSESKTNPINYI